MLKGTPNLVPLPEINLTPRVYIKKAGGQYVEILGVQSFERSDFENAENTVTFVLTGTQTSSATDLLNAQDKNVDVKMEFSLGATMVMTFSGQIEQFTGDTLSFSMDTPIVTEVLDNSVTLH